MAVALKPLLEMRPPAEPLLSLADFDALPEGPPDYEFEGGRLIDLPRPHARHQAILRELSAELTMYLRSHRTGICWPEIDVQLSRRRVYVPDLVFLSQDRRGRYSVDRGRVIGAPDLVVEIVSPASASRDRVAKFNAYREAGVFWYWLIDSQSLAIEEYRLMPEGYLAVARVAAGEIFRPQLFPELGVNLAELMGEAVGVEVEAQESGEPSA
jgi:Uma2 family endonuclease